MCPEVPGEGAELRFEGRLSAPFDFSDYLSKNLNAVKWLTSAFSKISKFYSRESIEGASSSGNAVTPHPLSGALNRSGIRSGGNGVKPFFSP